MTGRGTTLRLVAFMVIAVVGIGYTGAQYAGVDRLLGFGGYTVTMNMPDSGGVFNNSEVTYRGVAVGRVTQMDLTEGGIAVRMHIDSGAPPIPASTRAAVANRSAVGEQYVDLRPSAKSAPYLDEGSVIPPERTSTPLPPEALLVDLDRLVKDLPADDLRTVIDEVGTAFEGRGQDLQRILDSAGPLTREAQQHLPQTRGLLDNGDTVLRTQQEQGQQIRDFSEGLQQISGRLRDSDPDARRLLKTAPDAAGELDGFLRETGDDFGLVMANMLTTSKLTESRQAGIEQLLVAGPVISSFTHTLSPDATGHLGVVLNFFNPINCTSGYEGTPRKSGSETQSTPANTDLGCDEPPDSPTSVRGSQNAPREPIPEPVPPPVPLVP